MLLVVDTGNTHTVLGLYDGADLAHRFRLATDRSKTADEYGVVLGQLFRDRGLALADIDAAIIASVVPPVTPAIAAICRERLGVEPLIVGPGIKTGMPILYESPRDVGADRIVNGVAGYELFREDGPHGLIVVDFGTATTFDVVSPKGEYLGGAIAPGVHSSTEALFVHASMLPRVDLVMPQSSVGRTTVTSMQAGILYGYVGLVDGLVGRMRKELDFVPKVIATGGVAPLISEHSSAIERVEPDLTLEGLRIIYGRNQVG